MSENDLDGKEFVKVKLLLQAGRDLRKLTFNKCNLGKNALEWIGEGLCKNFTLTELSLVEN